MRIRKFALWPGVLALSACDRAVEQQIPANAEQPSNIVSQENERASPIEPEARTPLAEPKGPIDPKSTEAAGQIVQSYGALIEQKRWAEAEALWGDAGMANPFTIALKRYSEAHLEIGAPADPEGAAGSIYVTVPVVFYGRQSDGRDFRRPADVILRRVNDVPGSTEAQRRWHIDRIDWEN